MYFIDKERFLILYWYQYKFEHKNANILYTNQLKYSVNLNNDQIKKS